MKFLKFGGVAFLLAATLSLSACSRRPHAPQTVVTDRSEDLLAPFENSTKNDETALLQTSAFALRNGLSLSAGQAEKCWRDESARPAVKESCLLLWASGREPSASLEAVLLAGKSRLYSLAKIMARTPIQALNYEEMRELLDTLDQDPVWLRAEAIAIWTEKNAPLTETVANSFDTLIGLRPNSGPRDIAAAMRALKAIRSGLWQKALNGFCHSSAAGEARLRCWKAIGAMAQGGIDIADLVPYLPRAEDKDWTLFARSFPQQYKSIQLQLRK